MRVHSVNVGLPEEISDGKRTIVSGINKMPVGGRVLLRREHLEGDGQADLEAHGGEQRAVYAYPWVNFHYWARHFDVDGFAPGTFGENLTLDDVTDAEVCIGDRYRVVDAKGTPGGAVLEVTQPRSPCYKLEMRLGSPGFARLFLKSLRVGFYLRVLEEGEIGTGDVLEPIAEGPERMTVPEVCRLMFFDKDNLAGAERALRIPALSPGWREAFEERIAGGGEHIEEREGP